MGKGMGGKGMKKMGVMGTGMGMGMGGKQMMGMSGMGMGMGTTSSQEFVGEVKSFNESKGWGFVGSETVAALYGKDVLLPRRELPGGITVTPGSTCKFKVHQDARGLSACDVEMLSIAPKSSQEMMGMGMGMGTGGKRMGMGM